MRDLEAVVYLVGQALSMEEFTLCAELLCAQVGKEQAHEGAAARGRKAYFV